MKLTTLLLSASLAMIATGCATTSENTVRKANGVLVNAAGMTLYTFDKDSADSGKSVCNGPCATLWPAMPSTGASINPPFSVITRDDGKPQLAYKGKPLYLYSADKAAGDQSGDNFKGIWHVVKD